MWSTRTPTSSSSTSPRTWSCIRPPAIGPARWSTRSIAHCGESLSGIGGERRPGIVHRLDKDTTGLMVVAKNDRAHRALAAQFADHGRNGEPFERGYLAFVWGAPDRPRGTIDRPIDRHPKARDRMAMREGGREAVTHWEVLERYGGRKDIARRRGQAPGARPVASLLPAASKPAAPTRSGCIWPRSGIPCWATRSMGPGFRTKAALLPQQAQAALEALGRQALHAHILSIKHPTSGEILRFRSELPPDLARLHESWRPCRLILAINRDVA